MGQRGRDVAEIAWKSPSIESTRVMCASYADAVSKSGKRGSPRRKPEKGALNCTHRRLLDDVQDGDGELRVREGVRLGVDFGHGVCRDCGGRRTFGQNGSDEGPRELPCRSAAIRSAPSREEGFFRGARSAHEGASKDAR
jgi:hypothetical protein